MKAGDDGIVISAVDGEVQAWNAADGRLAWECRGDGPVKGLAILGEEGQRGVVVYSEEEGSRAVVRKLAADSGDVVWEHTDAR